MTNTPLHAEWTAFFDPETIKSSGNRITLEPTEAERKDIARRFDISAIHALEAKVTITSERPHNFAKVAGTLTATIEQKCIITEAPVTTEITEDIEGWFAEPEKVVSFNKARREKAIKNGDEIQMLEENEDPEPLTEGQIDLGELAVQHLSLALPQYPKAEGAQYDGDHVNTAEEEQAFDNPFAKLAEWKDKLGEE